MTIAPLHRLRARRTVGRARAPARALSETQARSAAAGLGAFLLGASTPGWRAAAALPLGAWLGGRLHDELRARTATATAAAASREMPDLLDRMSICVTAGMSVEKTLRTVAVRSVEPVRSALNDGLRALDAGVPRRRAYERIAEASHVPAMQDLMAALARAEALGTPVGDALAAQASELRSRARAAAEAEARTAPVKLVFPLVFCFLPAFVLLTVAPIAISAVRSLGGI